MNTQQCQKLATLATNVYSNEKKYYAKLMAITLSIFNEFSKFFHCWKKRL